MIFKKIGGSDKDKYDIKKKKRFGAEPVSQKRFLVVMEMSNAIRQFL